MGQMPPESETPDCAGDPPAVAEKNIVLSSPYWGRPRLRQVRSRRALWFWAKFLLVDLQRSAHVHAQTRRTSVDFGFTLWISAKLENDEPRTALRRPGGSVSVDG